MNKLQSNLCLICVTLCWSTEVIIFACIPDTVSPFATTCITNLIAALIMFACFFKRVIRALRSVGKSLMLRLLFLGALNCTYNLLYIYGLKYFDVSSGAFTVSMTAVVLPVVLLTMRKGVDKKTWISVIIVLLGIGCALGNKLESTNYIGFIIMLIGCVIRAFYIVKLNDYARRFDPVALSTGVSSVVGILSFGIWTAMQPATFAAFEWNTQIIASLVIYSYFVISFAQTINIFAQRRATAADATIIYSLEIVFSVIWGSVLPAGIVDQVALTPALIAGCALIVCGSLVQIIDFHSLLSRKSSAKPDAAKLQEADLGSEAQAETDLDKTPISKPTTPRIPEMSIPNPKPKRTIPRKLMIFAVLLGAYIAVSLPFKVLSVIPGFTDIRPVALLQPIYGIFFGPWGALAFATGNLISDIASDSLRWSSIAGFAANFLYPYIMYLFWSVISKKQFDLRSGRNICKHMALIIGCAAMMVAVITPAVAMVYPDVDAQLFAISVMLNHSLFSIGLGMPLIMLVQEELGLKPWPRPRLKKLPGAGDADGKRLDATA